MKKTLTFLTALLLSIACYNVKAQNNTGQAFAHFSIDDVLEPLQDITSNKDKYESLFENDFFAYLKTLHDKYGICVTCNLFERSRDGFTVNDITDSFKEEFEKNSSWLRFSWHGRNGFERYTSQELNEEAVLSYKAVNDAICRFAGKNALSTFIRPSFFSGNKALWTLFKDSSYSLEGIYTSDDGREADAGLNEKERETIAASYNYTDPETKIEYIKSIVRFDGKKPEQGREIIEKVVEREEKPAIYGIFMHQQSIVPYDANACGACEEAIKYLHNKGIRFAFPQK